MKLFHSLIIIISMTLLSCSSLESEITVDELSDKGEYSGGMMVDCSSYGGELTKRLVLNNQEHSSPELVDLRKAGYYRIELYPGANGSSSPRVIRVVILDKLRGETDWGLPVWTPLGVKTKVIKDEEIRLVHSRNIPENTSYPVVVLAGGALSESLINLNAEISSTKFLIKRGVGSAWAKPGGDSEPVVRIDHVKIPIVTSPSYASPLIISGNLTEDMNVPAGTYVDIPEDVSIAQGITLTIGEGSFVTLAEGVNIYLVGSLLIPGTEEEPVTLTCSDPESFWGGVIGSTSVNRIEASHTLFCRSGFNTGENYDYGHAKRQALFYNNYGSLKFSHCYMIDHIGQVFYPRNASLEISYCLIQRAKTGGQINHSEVIIEHSVFTDFPDDQRIYQDQDNDALYLSASNATIRSSVFMYAADDGLDSGGDQGGEISVSNTRFESVFHEGAALSSGGTATKNHYFKNCLFIDCGQGLELGFSSPNHLVSIDSCTFSRNGVGIRYGDNYPMPHFGQMSISNSESINNLYQDVWNMLRERWEADTSKMEFTNVRVSRPNPLYPQLIPYE